MYHAQFAHYTGLWWQFTAIGSSGLGGYDETLSSLVGHARHCGYSYLGYSYGSRPLCGGESDKAWPGWWRRTRS